MKNKLILVYSLVIVFVIVFIVGYFLVKDSPGNHLTINTNLKEGKILPSKAIWKESPFIFDEIFEKDKTVNIYESGNLNLQGSNDHSYRFLCAKNARLTVNASFKDKNNTPRIWLYNEDGKLISSGNYVRTQNGGQFTYVIKTEGFYKLRLLFNQGNLQRATLSVSFPVKNVKSKQAILTNYISRSLKTIELKIDPNQLKVFRDLKSKQHKILLDSKAPEGLHWPPHPDIQGRFIARIQVPGKSSWSIASIGVAGRNIGHLTKDNELLPSLDINIVSGELPYGLEKFKLYTISSKNYLKEMIFESILRDAGLLIPRQDYIKVIVNGKFAGFMELLEDIDTTVFEYAQRLEGPVIGYDVDTLYSQAYMSEFKERGYYKQKLYKKTPNIISNDFKESICKTPLLNAVSFAIAHGGLHGLNQGDLRFHINKRKHCLDPLVKDFNSGIHAIHQHNQAVFNSLLITLSTFTPSWRPLVAAHSSNYILKQNNKETIDTFHWWAVHPGVFSFFENEENTARLNSVFSFWNLPLVESQIKNRFSNAASSIYVIKNIFTEYDLAQFLHRLSEGISFISQIPKITIQDVAISSSTLKLKNLIEKSSKDQIKPSTFSLKNFEWRNKTTIKLFEEFKQNNHALNNSLGLQIKNINNLVRFLYREENNNQTHLFFIKRQIASNQDFIPKDFILIDKYTKKTYEPLKIIESGNTYIQADKEDILLNKTKANEHIKIYYFKIPKTKKYNYLIPEVKNDTSYLGVREYAITPKSKPIKSTEEPPLSKYFNIENNTLKAKNNKLHINEEIKIPAKYKLVIDKDLNISFGTKGCIEINGLLEVADDATLKLSASGKYWRGIHFHKNNDLKLQNIIVEDIGDKSPETQCRGRSYTGGFSIYNTRANIKNITITSSMIEDALHLLNSEVYINNIDISMSQSDAIDSDFSSITINSSNLADNDGDGLDISGSYLAVDGGTYKNNGDKNISIGENSIAKIKNINILSSQYGIALKDSSSLSIQNSKIESCRIGIAKYIKKPYFSEPTLLTQSMILFKDNTFDIKDLRFKPEVKKRN